jgi:hypothetical protein
LGFRLSLLSALTFFTFLTFFSLFTLNLLSSVHHEVNCPVPVAVPGLLLFCSVLISADYLSLATIGTALAPSALLVAGVYAIKPEFVAYAVAVAGVLAAFLALRTCLSTIG